MDYSTSDLREHADEVVASLSTRGEPLIITQDGEPKAVLQDIRSYKETQETLALLQLLMLSREEARAGHTRPIRDVIAELRHRIPA